MNLIVTGNPYRRVLQGASIPNGDIIMELRTFEWNGDWEDCRAAADAGEFDTELAKAVGKKMYQTYRLEQAVEKPHKVGWSMSTSHTFDVIWTTDKRVIPLSEKEAKILFLASSDVFAKLEFGGRTTAEKHDDLRDRMSRLCEMAYEMNLVIDKHVDYDWDKYESRWEQVEEMEEEYQTLFSETVRIYSN